MQESEHGEEEEGLAVRDRRGWSGASVPMHGQEVVDRPKQGHDGSNDTQLSVLDSVARRYSQWILEHGFPKCGHNNTRREGSVLCSPCRSILKKFIANRCVEFGCSRGCTSGVLSDNCNIFLNKAISSVAKAGDPRDQPTHKRVSSPVEPENPEKHKRPKSSPSLTVDPVATVQENYPRLMARESRPQSEQLKKVPIELGETTKKEKVSSSSRVSQACRKVGFDILRAIPVRLNILGSSARKMRTQFDALCDELAIVRNELEFAAELLDRKASPAGKPPLVNPEFPKGPRKT
uniref:Uncharacterized protein n=1 Tax=Compsopogon caeruleus TaxID=31354 RepID=A0A7S1XAV0_9RHOD